jgi:antitoxin ParD1/3/4
MAEGVNVRFAGELQRFLQTRIGNSGLYGSASEYIRDLVRRDYEKEEERKWALLRQTLKSGLEADESEFATLDAEQVIAEAKSRRKKDGS